MEIYLLFSYGYETRCLKRRTCIEGALLDRVVKIKVRRCNKFIGRNSLSLLFV